MNQAELPRPSRRRRLQSIASAPQRPTASLTVAWTPTQHGASSRLAATEIELVNGFGADAGLTWTCPGNAGASWLEALASAHCIEVVLTARIGNDLTVKHSVLELAELLTFRLTESHPLIRVRFVPTASAPPARRTQA